MTFYVEDTEYAGGYEDAHFYRPATFEDIDDELVGTVCAIIENRCGIVRGIGPAVREALAAALTRTGERDA